MIKGGGGEGRRGGDEIFIIIIDFFSLQEKLSLWCVKILQKSVASMSFVVRLMQFSAFLISWFVTERTIVTTDPTKTMKEFVVS